MCHALLHICQCMHVRVKVLAKGLSPSSRPLVDTCYIVLLYNIDIDVRVSGRKKCSGVRLRGCE